MGLLFGKKKKKEVKLEEPPAFPSPLDNLPELPEKPEIKLPEIKLKDIGTEELKPVETDKNSGFPENIEKFPVEKPEEKIEINETPLETPSTPSPTEEISTQIKGPIFVRITKYKKILNILEKVNKEIENLEEDVKKLEEIKSKEDQEIKKISEEIIEIKRKAREIESGLFSKLE